MAFLLLSFKILLYREFFIMKIGSCRYQHQVYIYIDQATELLLPALCLKGEDQAIWQDMLALIARESMEPGFIENTVALLDKKAAVAVNQVKYLAPIPRPNKNIMCLGLNYLEHAEETAAKVGRSAKKPSHPIVFTKAAHTVIGHEAEIPYHEASCKQLDWEVELGVVIGKGGRNIQPEDAWKHIFGYTIINDISARDLQFQHKQFFLGKSIDGGCPIGPYIVLADTIDDAQNLTLQCKVNGQLKQRSNTQHMIFDIPSILATLSKGMALESGDLIATGTPSGVGFARQPPEFIKRGDIIECEVEGIGVLRNRLA